MNAQSLRRGLACAGSIISVIDRVPPININDETAEDIQAIDDDITFDHVSFKYEGRNKTILDDVSLSVSRAAKQLHLSVLLAEANRQL